MYSENGVCCGIPIFLTFDPKHRLWVIVRSEAVLTCTHNLCFEQKLVKISFFSSENFQFLQKKKKKKKICILHGRVFVMLCLNFNQETLP